MALADIKKKIEGEARTEADEILSRARAQAEHVAAKAETEVRHVERNLQERLAAEEPEIQRRRRIVAGLDVRKAELDARRNVLRRTFETALEDLKSLPADRYSTLVTILLEKAMETKTEQLLVGDKETVVTSQWLDAFNEAHQSRLSLAEEKLPERGGFVLRNGRIDVNCTFGMLVHSLEDDLEAEIVGRLFA